MKNAVINFQTQPIIKQKAQKVADELGFGLSTLLNGFLHHLIKTKTIEFSAYDSEQPSEYLIQILTETEKQRKKGEFISFKNPNKAVDYVASLINRSGISKK